jgi:hypothetical protein
MMTDDGKGVPLAGEEVVGDGVVVTFGVHAPDLHGNVPVDSRRPILVAACLRAQKQATKLINKINIKIM